MTQTHQATNAEASPYVKGLEERHSMLEKRLSDLRAHPSTDDLEIASVKREKLRIKERLEGIARH